MAEPSFKDLCRIVADASSPDEVFSSLRLVGRVGCESVLRGEYERLRAVIEPSHVMVCPEDHNVFLVDW